MAHRYELQFGGRSLTIESGKLAELANGAVTVRYGDTIVLATATAARQPRPDADFFPLTVDYEERMYAAGKIPGGFFKREGRPTENAILTMRLTDRPIRPFFPKGFRNEVQIIITVLSADQENEPGILAIIGASAALTVSDIPFEGPVAGVKVGRIGGQFVLNPTSAQLDQSDMELVLAGTADAIAMVEAGAKEVSEQVMLDGLRFGHESMQELIALQNRMRDEIGKPKFTVATKSSAEVEEAVRQAVGGRIDEVLRQTEKQARGEARDQLVREAVEKLGEQFSSKEIGQAVDELETEHVRRGILEDGKRPDGRGLTDIRPITCEVGYLPRVHGSGLFKRGQTQVLSIVTLGSIGDEQVIDGLGPNQTKRFMHHYNMPPYSVGEVRRSGSPGRREIGHGALAERAIAAVMPSSNDFPYTVRVVSEVVSSNGSTSMGSVCGSVLALMDAGVPIKSPVAGVAMGLITDPDGSYAILTDIQGIEDHLGDMDFKVAGTANGVTALQMDMKVRGLSSDVLTRAMQQAHEGRLFILGKMLEAISAPRDQLSSSAPRIFKTQIAVDKIGALIGPGGRNIRGLQEQHKVKIDVEENGMVYISSTDAEGAQRALRSVQGLGKDIEIGEEYLGKVTRLTNFGAFVEILPGKEGLVRVGDLAEYRVNRVEDVVSIGDEIMVRVVEVDPQGRVNLSRRAVLEGVTPGASEGPDDGEADGEGGGGIGGPPRRPPFGPPRGPLGGRGPGGPPRRGPGGPGGPGGDRGFGGGPPRDRGGFGGGGRRPPQ
ncbi:MAG TPA: polyribonucleotide nucleotidyltransferase [Chloroflexota bacterium]|nr:polyribonucleotide nucleotidyltransferase [Chloroflexota bacterium]